MTIRLDDEFLTKGLTRLIQKEWLDLTVSVRESVIMVTVAVKKWGLVLRFTGAARLVDFHWDQQVKSFTVEVVRTSVLDVATALGIVKRYLPGWIHAQTPYLQIQLHEADPGGSVFGQAVMKDLVVTSIRQETGWLEVVVDWDEDQLV